MVLHQLKTRTSQKLDVDLESAKKAAYCAIDKVMDRLKDKIAQEDLQTLSEELAQEGKAITRALLDGVIDAKITPKAKKHMQCPGCQHWIKSYENQKKKIVTLHGETVVERPYFYCKRCKKGHTPLDEELGLSKQKHQYDLQRKAMSLLARMPYEEASQVFEEFTGEKLSDHAMHDLAGEIAKASSIENVLPTKEKIAEVIAENTVRGKWRPILMVMADGVMLPMRPNTGSRKGKRGEGEWKEAKGIRIVLVTADEVISLLHWHEIANEQEFGEALDFCSTLIPQDQVRIGLIADGAQWIWSHFQRVFPKGQQILDYYHCSQHLHQAAKAQFKTEQEQKVWVEATMGQLFMGEAPSVIKVLQKMEPRNPEALKEIKNLAGYLSKNEHRVNYKSLKKGQYPIGSGAMESANRFICQIRMKRPGCWWYTIHGNAMLRLRSAMYNRTFDAVFDAYKKQVSLSRNE